MARAMRAAADALASCCDDAKREAARAACKMARPPRRYMRICAGNNDHRRSDIYVTLLPMRELRAARAHAQQLLVTRDVVIVTAARVSAYGAMIMFTRVCRESERFYAT